ncbi:MAG: metallophosphoesterase [Calditrichia bacterium]
MKISGFFVFLSIVLLIYASVNFYILRRLWQALGEWGIYRHLIFYVVLLLMLSYPVGRFTERIARSGFSESLVSLGSFYLAMMVYAFFLLLLVDILRLGNHLFSIFPSFITADPQKSVRLTALGITLILGIIVGIGHLNALHPVVRTVNIHLPKAVNPLPGAKIVLVSDIHLGTLIRNSRLLKIVRKINSLKPDVVLLAGDVVDEDVAPVAEQNMAENLRQIRSKWGTYAITGNHEYFGGVERAISYLQQGQVTVLQDSAVKVANAFYLIGRKDRIAEQMAGGRKSLAELMEGVDRNWPLILLDHQPFHLDSAQQQGIDLQLSGHTHHGQLFPFNWITRRVYELSWGYLRKGNTHYYVSCGVGTWGPPIRIGSRPEIVEINLTFGVR